MDRRVRVALAFGVVAVAVVGGSAVEACRDSTQVTVDLRTLGIACSSLKGVSIVVARSPQDAEDRMALGSFSAQVERGVCDGERIGTLVVTPEGPRGAIVVAARISDDAGATCKPPAYRGCIVARRSFAFLDHVSVTLPITLEVACADVPCDVVTSCRSGSCVSANAECSEGSQRCESPAEPVLLPDGGVAPPDAASVDGSTRDGSAPGDAAGDAADGGPDDGAVATHDGATNICPYVDGSKPDCTLASASAVCCLRPQPGGPVCLPNAAGCGLEDPALPCLGAAHCGAGAYCCYRDLVIPPTSSCAATCAKGSRYLCTTDADCPPTMGCNTPGPVLSGTPHPICGPK
jgi:hypothetical protein